MIYSSLIATYIIVLCLIHCDQVLIPKIAAQHPSPGCPSAILLQANFNSTNRLFIIRFLVWLHYLETFLADSISIELLQQGPTVWSFFVDKCWVTRSLPFYQIMALDSYKMGLYTGSNIQYLIDYKCIFIQWALPAFYRQHGFIYIYAKCLLNLQLISPPIREDLHSLKLGYMYELENRYDVFKIYNHTACLPHISNTWNGPSHICASFREYPSLTRSK